MERKVSERLLAGALLVAAVLFPVHFTLVGRVSAAWPLQRPNSPHTDSTIFLPLILMPPGPPQIEIVAPGTGWEVSGMQFFAVQPLAPGTVSAVVFKAGSQTLGTDSTPADGFKLLFDANTFPGGPLQLTATAEGPGGQTTQQVNVTVVSNPPASAVLADGGVLATETGSVITFPPGAVPSDATVTVTERSQSQVTSEHGIDWEQLGITFLGDQRIVADGDVVMPVRVSSAGFGNRVQPGQAVVNYTLLPDANGDGIDELVVINSASVAPNNAVVSDPVPQVLLNSIQTPGTAGRQGTAGSEAVAGTPGTSVVIRLNGLNSGSLLGNVGTWESLEDDTTFAIAGKVAIDPFDPGQQIFTTFIPPLPPGQAELRLQNATSGAVTAPIAVNVLPSAPLIKPAITIIEEFLADTLAFWQGVPASTPLEADAIVQASTYLVEVQDRLAQIAASQLTPEQQQILDTAALILQNSSIYEVVALQGAADPPDSGYSLDSTIGNTVTVTGFVALVIERLATQAGWEAVIPLAARLGAASTTIGFAILACPYVLQVDSCFDELVDALPELPDLCWPTLSLSGGPGSFNIGSGSVPVTGGQGCGNVIGPASAGLADLTTGRISSNSSDIIVKIFTGSQLFPISGAVDAGGYFYLPLIPAGEPYTALAIDPQSGRTRVQHGMGPAVDTMAFMLFDFSSGVERHELTMGQTLTGSIGYSGEQDIYVLSGSAGDDVLFRLIATSGNLASQLQVLRPDGTPLCQRSSFVFSLIEFVCTLDVSGYHIVAISANTDAETGDYALFSQRSNMPAAALNVPYGSVAQGSTTAGVELAAYTFTGVNGDQLLARVTRETDTLNPALYVYRPDGSLLCQQVGILSLIEGYCALDATGPHALLVGDGFGQGFGDHSLFLQRLNNPVGTTPISYGQTHTGTIDPPVKVDSYSFTGTQDDSVLIRVTQTGGALHPEFRVYRPDYTLLCQFTATIGAVAERECTLDASGAFLILVGDWQGDSAGTYQLFMEQRLRHFLPRRTP